MKKVVFQEPFDRFKKWLAEAEKSEPNNHNAMAVATTPPSGRPSVRMVLLKGWDERGFVFYTNFESRKGEEILSNQFASLLFHWKSLNRQIRIEGAVEVVGADEADEYFSSRYKASQIGAWASDQSREMKGRFEFEANIAKYTAKYAIGKVPRPPHWSGFRIIPDRFEFWADRQFRLHERFQYSKDEAEGDWSLIELFP